MNWWCLVGLAVAAACSSGSVGTLPGGTPRAKVAVEFATALGSGDFARAHSYLSSSLRSTTTVEKLRADYEAMVSNGSGPPTTVSPMTAMERWPDMQRGDVEWIYVAIANDTYSEAVTVVVAEESDKLVIRSIEWGRP